MPSEREQIAAAYEQQLGRKASEDELNQWLSGAYGYGQAGNLAPILGAIGQSGEAQSYRNRPGQTATQNAVLGLTQRDALRRGDTGTMLGFNTGDYGGDTKARTSVKNMFGRIASRYGSAPGSIDAIMADPDFKALFPNARKVAGGAGDKIDFGGVKSDFESGVPVGVVDVLQNSDPTRNSATGWQWLPEDVGQGGPANAAYNRTQAAIVGVPNPTTSSTMPVTSGVPGVSGDSSQTAGDAVSRYYQMVAEMLAETERQRQPYV